MQSGLLLIISHHVIKGADVVMQRTSLIGLALNEVGAGCWAIASMAKEMFWVSSYIQK